MYNLHILNTNKAKTWIPNITVDNRASSLEASHLRDPLHLITPLPPEATITLTYMIVIPFLSL